jgi:hypothetical protein
MDRMKMGAQATGKTLQQMRTGTKAAMEGGTKVYQAGSSRLGDLAGGAYNRWSKHLDENPKSFKDLYSLKSIGVTAGIGAAMYGLSAVMTDDTSADAGDRMSHYVKHGVAGAADVTADLALTGVAAGLTAFGPVGALLGGGLMAYNMLGGFFGMDAGTGVMNLMNYADEKYEEQRQGPKFNMTQNTSMAMQRQISNLHANGSNLGEMMHN